MCNCSSTPSNICNQCVQGLPCGCPPDYNVIPQPVTGCYCCPDGYTYGGPTANYQNGSCTKTGSSPLIIIEATPCNDCEESVSSTCVKLPTISCLGLPEGASLTDLANYLCSEAFASMILTRIGLSTTLKSQLCSINSTCPPTPSGTTPIIGPIIVTYP